MKTITKPMKTTIVFGLIGGLSFKPLVIGFSYVLSWSPAFYLTIWLYLAAYCVLLIKNCRKKITAIIFPLLIALLTIIWTDSVFINLMLAAGVLSWVRSGICYPDRLAKRFIAEIVLCAGGSLMVAGFGPVTLLSWAMAIWMFILIQALYFVFFENSFTEEHELEQDPFEAAREQAENILSAGL